MHTDKAPSNATPSAEHQALLMAQLHAESARQVEQSLFLEHARTLAIIKPINTQVNIPKTTPNIPIEPRDKNAVKAIVLPHRTNAPPAINYQTKAQSELTPKAMSKQPVVAMLPQPSRTEKSQHHASNVKIKTASESAAQPDQSAHSVVDSEVHTSAIATESSNIPDFDYDAEQDIAHQGTALSEEEILELVDWIIWEDELTEDVQDQTSTEKDDTIGLTELSADDTKSLADLNIFSILNGENVEASDTNYLGTIVIGALFEINKPFEPMDDRSLTPSQLESQIKVEIITYESLDAILLKTFENQIETPDFSVMESSQAETALALFEAIVLAVNDMVEQSAAKVISEVVEQEEIYKLCIELFACLSININDETISQLILNIKNSLVDVAQKSSTTSLAELSDLGSHERKFGHKFSPASLIRTIKKELEQQIRLGRYILYASIN